MSLKVWEAYRIREGYDHWDVLMKIKSTAREGIKVELLKLMAALQKGFNEGTDKEKAGLVNAWNEVIPRSKKEVGDHFSLLDINYYLKAQYGAQLAKSEKDPFDFNVSVAARRHEGRWILIPYGNMYGLLRGCLSFMDKMEELEDYHYQNSTDPPDPEPENWEERSRVWNDICDNSWQDFLILDIVSYEAWFDASPAWDRAFQDARKAINDGMSAEEAVKTFL